MNKSLIIGVIVVVLLGSFFIINNKKEGPVACTLEARLCADGSSVGRTGPMCEFAECPVPTVIEHGDIIKVFSPTSGALITSPMSVTGEARGNWYFEASFPVRLYDANGKELAVIPAQAEGEWMTTNYVPFSVTLNFETPTTPTGTLVLEKDNPSGLPEFDDKVSIPVRFSP